MIARVAAVTALTLAAALLGGSGCTLIFNDDFGANNPAQFYAGCFEEPAAPTGNPPRDWIVLRRESNTTLSGCHRDERTNIDNSVGYVVDVSIDKNAPNAEQPVTLVRNEGGTDIRLNGTLLLSVEGDTFDPANDTMTLNRPNEDPDRPATVVFMTRCEIPHDCSELGLPLAGTSGPISAPTSGLESILRPFAQPAMAFRPVMPPVRDPRFFGTYCSEGPRDFCKTVRVDLGLFSFGVRRVCATVSDVRVRLTHVPTPAGALLHGGGTFRVDGKAGTIALAGSVTQTGRARMDARVPQVGHEVGDMWLQAGGRRASALAHGEHIEVSKEACGNRAPVVTISTTTGSLDHLRGRACFEGRVLTDEDAGFPIGRMEFSSNRDGVLAGPTAVGPRSARVCVDHASAGRRRIAFAATDGGGLTGTATLEIVLGAVVAPVD
jgi:hypothetical protein